MRDGVVIVIEREVRDILKVLKGDKTYNTQIKLYFKQRELLKRLLKDNRIDNYLLRNYKELFIDSGYLT